MVKPLHKLSLLLVAGLWLGSGNDAQAQVNLSSASYTQNFEGMGTTLPAGWEALRLAGSGTINQSLSPVVNDGSGNSGAIYSVGAASAADRALGVLASGSTVPAFGIAFKNTSGATKSGLTIEAMMEQWKTGSLATVNEEVIFEYSLDATSLSTGIWKTLASLNLVEKLTDAVDNAAVNGNLAANRTAITGTITETLAPDAIIYLRWKDTNDGGNDGIYAIDDFSVSFIAGATDVTAPSLGATPFMPADNATGIATTTNLTITFNEAVKLGAGAFTLYNLSDNTNSALTAAVEGSTVTLTSATALQPGKNYAIQVAANAVTDIAGNAFAGITDNTTWNFTTASTASPVITTAVSSLTFGTTSQGKTSAVQSYEFSASNLTGDVTVAVTGPFQIAKRAAAELGNFGTTALTFTQAEITAGEKVYVRFAPSAAGAATGSITHNTTGGQEVTVALTGSAFNPYVQNFNDAAFLTNSGWSQFSVSGAQVWASTNFGQTCLSGCTNETPDKAAQINGYSNGNNVNEDWLISPSMDLASFTNYPVLQFASISAFAGNQLKLMYSTDYTGTGNPTAATWTEIPNVFPASNSSVWTVAEGIELPKNANVYVAFVYTSTAEAASRWTVDNFKVEDKASFYQIPTSLLSFGEVAPGAMSDPQTFTLKAAGSGNVTVTAPAGFKVKASGSTYEQSVVVTETAAAAGQIISIVYAPTTKVVLQKGAIAITGTGLDVKTIMVEGSSYFKSETFEVTTFNMEFFATDMKSDTNFEYGPTNDALQVENATKVMQTIKSDIFAVQEVVDEPELDKVVAAMPGYAKRISPAYSFSVRQSNNTTPFPAQKVGFVYNTATVTPVGFRVMFEDLYKRTVDGATNTGIDAGFWSSGRLPYMGIFNVTVDGKTQRVYVVNVHTKAGSESGDYTDRLKDVQVLSDSLKAHYGNVNLILLGDFNDDVSKSTRGANYVSTFNPIVTDVANYKTLTYELSQAGATSHPTVSGGNFLDHIVISNELVDEYIESSIVIEDPRNYISGYLTTTSDHLPVTARFALSGALGIRDAIAGTFGVYPNPTVGKITLQLPAKVSKQSKVNLTLYTTRGEVLLQTAGTEQALNQELSRVLQKSAAGLYLIKIQAGSETYQARVIKN
ncbi:T9SS type A sorting domain-containing protein [Nibribacter ruber]|uniref:T9SS type A sorting domain-containing protein n=1 Tax=Nibribacter ruber TaxID=2698458 RepID=A0A6P1NVV8_9BACT|nr:Ig-like domain-containing protein [Nibribacter ruber]QHL87200.1 T9SS type A sorting domain-containing protein [Nibribacter ruber]